MSSLHHVFSKLPHYQQTMKDHSHHVYQQQNQFMNVTSIFIIELKCLQFNFYFIQKTCVNHSIHTFLSLNNNFLYYYRKL